MEKRTLGWLVKSVASFLSKLRLVNAIADNSFTAGLTRKPYSKAVDSLEYDYDVT